MIKALFAGALVAGITTLAVATTAEARGQARMQIIDGDRGHVVYDDGRDDGACIFRRKFAGYDYWGNPRFRKVYHCYR